MSDRTTGFQEIHEMEIDKPIDDLKKENEALKDLLKRICNDGCDVNNEYWLEANELLKETE